MPPRSVAARLLVPDLWWIVLFALWILAHSATRYAAPSGSASCGNSSSGNPIGGLGNGLNCLNGGDTLILKDGIYPTGIYRCGDGCAPQ